MIILYGPFTFYLVIKGTHTERVMKPLLVFNTKAPILISRWYFYMREFKHQIRNGVNSYLGPRSKDRKNLLQKVQ